MTTRQGSFSGEFQGRIGADVYTLGQTYIMLIHTRKNKHIYSFTSDHTREHHTEHYYSLFTSTSYSQGPLFMLEITAKKYQKEQLGSDNHRTKKGSKIRSDDETMDVRLS